MVEKPVSLDTKGPDTPTCAHQSGARPSTPYLETTKHHPFHRALLVLPAIAPEQQLTGKYPTHLTDGHGLRRVETDASELEQEPRRCAIRLQKLLCASPLLRLRQQNTGENLN